MESEPLSQARLRHQLDVQLRQISRVLLHHRIPATVAGGSVSPSAVNFDIQTQLTAGLERVRGLKDDLMAALGVGDVALVNESGQWRLRVSHPEEAAVPLLKQLAATSGNLPPTTTVIGLADGGRPVLLRFAAHHVKHALIAGEEGAGKTALLRTIAAGLAVTSRQSELQMIVMDPRGLEKDGEVAPHPLKPLGYLPHMLTDPVGDPADCASIVHFLAEEMEYRRRERLKSPRIVVFLDHIVTFLEAGGQGAEHDLLRLVQHGAGAGIHLVLASDRPASPLLVDRTLRAGVSLRIIGRMADRELARQLAGVQLDQAPLLYGGGDFLAVINDNVSYFQAAYIGDYDLHLKLNEIYKVARPRLLARPYSSRPRIEADRPSAADRLAFSVRDGAINVEDADREASAISNRADKPEEDEV